MFRREGGNALGPSLVAPSRGDVTVWWRLGREEEVHRVDWGTTAALENAVEFRGPTRSPSVRLAGLPMGEVLHYRVASGGARSDARSFRLPAPDSPLRLAIWADNQSGARVFRKWTVPALTALSPDALLAAGDLVERGDREKGWSDELYRPAGPLLGRVPWIPVRGNHDGESELAREMCPLPENGRWYALSVGPLRVAVLDTNLDHGPGSEQARWLAAELAGDPWRAARFRLAAFHHPAFATLWHETGYDGEISVREHILPLLSQAGADLAVSGHAHCYERGSRERPDGGRTWTVTTGGGGGALDGVRVGDWPHVERCVRRHHVVLAEVGDREMRLRAVDSATGETLDAFAIPGAARPSTRCD